jgi:hypothetical protein
MTVRLKHRWSITHNYLAGITTAGWYRLLCENKFDVDWVYWHRAAFITAASLINSLYCRREKRLYDAAVERVQITEPPLFILGHWRSGTTLLHNLLAQNSDRFAYANTYQVVNPHTFLSTEEVNSKRFAALVPKKRPMDNMELSFETPQEDEFAPCLLTLRSLYLGISFPRREDYYARFLTFRGVPREEVEAWKDGFAWFLKKLTFKYGRALVLKSPPHTARIRILLQMFPTARFVHIHRDPYRVFQSSRHYFDTATWYTYLQRPELEGMDERIIRRYTALYDAFFEDKTMIPSGQFHEVRFEDLEGDPLSELRVLYKKLVLPDFDTLEPKMKAYVDSLSGYRKNEFPELSPALRHKVAEAWHRSFDEWGYVR